MAITKDLAFAPIRTLGKKLRAGEFTSLELTKFFLHRLDTVGREYRAIVTITTDLAIEEAKRADKELADGKDRGPLHGIPYGVKDLAATKGYPTTWGAKPLKDRVIDADATIVKDLRNAGAVLVGKLAMVAFAGGLGYSGPDNCFTGPCLNPWSKGRWAGGSSSGPGSAAGGGMVPFAIGSETSGSIISPSAYCGVSGLRPTFGRVSRAGAMALSWTLDKLGPMCRSADCCGLVLDAIAGPDPADATTVDRPFSYPAEEALKPPFKLAVLKGAVEKVQPAVKTNYEKSLEVIKDFATLEEIEEPDSPYSLVVGTILSSEAAAAFEDLVLSGEIQHVVDPRTRIGAYALQVVPAKDYINAMRLRVKLQKEIDALIAPFDAIVTPTQAAVAHPSDLKFGEYAGSRGLRTVNFRQPGNLAGLPSISVPNGFGEDNMPTGLQFVGRAFDENKILTIANKFQSNTDWNLKHPNI